jgi:hypothetical protein
MILKLAVAYPVIQPSIHFLYSRFGNFDKNKVSGFRSNDTDVCTGGLLDTV